MAILFDLAIIGASAVGLWWGAVWVVEAASRIAQRLGMSQLVIGLTVVAIGTSAPEFTVTIAAAMQGLPDISVGNVIGSNIFNLGFILGTVALLYPLATTRALVYRDGLVVVGAALLTLVFFMDLTLTRWEGVALLVLLALYIGWLLYRREPIEEEVPVGAFRWYEIPRLLAGLAIIAISGFYLVESASNLARGVGVSEWVIGVTIVAAGTSLPEAATSVVAVLHGRHGISAGNLIGSTIFNLLGVLGLAAVLRPLTVESLAMDSMLAQLGLTLLVVLVMRTGWKISRREGLVLLLLAAMSWGLDFARQG